MGCLVLVSLLTRPFPSIYSVPRMHLQTPAASKAETRSEVTMYTILLIILILLLIGALPTWPYSSGWGYYPSGGLGVILLIIIVLILLGR